GSSGIRSGHLPPRGFFHLHILLEEELPLARVTRVGVFAAKQGPKCENVQPSAHYDRLCLGGVIFRMSTSSFRVWILIPPLTLFVAALTLWPAVGPTDVVLAPGTETTAGGATAAWLVSC